MKKIVAIIIGILTAAIAMKSVAQNCLKINGNIQDGFSGELLPGATIQLSGTDTGTITNLNGEFEIGVSIGDTLIISFIGYTPLIVAVSELKRCNEVFRLISSTTQMEEVVIKSERLIAEEFTIKKISKLEIYTNPSAKADPILAVNSTPSATTTDESANISLRGGRPDETGIFLNNVPINDPVRYSQMNGIGTFSIFNTALVKNVQVYPGNPPLEFGNSTSGLIAVQTDEEIPDYHSTMYSLTMASLGFYTNRKLSKRSSLAVYSNYQPSVLLRAINPKALEDLNTFSSLDLGIQFLYTFKKDAVIKIFNYSLSESYEYKNESPTYSGIFYQDKIRNFTVANFRKRINTIDMSINQGVSFSNGRYQYGNLDIAVALDDLFTSINFQQTKERNEWKTGISFDHRGSDFSGSFPTYYYAVGNQYPSTSTSSEQAINNLEWYGYYKYYFGPKWIGGIGVRKSIPTQNLSGYLSYQANANFKPKESWNFNAAFGSYNKYQLPQEENTRPVLLNSKQYSLDVAYKTKPFEFTTSLFYKTQTAGLLTGTVAGLEFSTRFTVLSRLRFQFSATSLDAHQSIETIEQPSPYNIHYFLKGNIEYKFSGTWTTTAVFLFRQGSYYHPVENTRFDNTLMVYEPVHTSAQRLPAYNTIDLSVSKLMMINEKTTAIAFVSISNVFDFKNVRGYTYNFDYTNTAELYFSLRTFYFGLVLNVNKVPRKK